MVRVFDGGTYIQVAFYTPKDSKDELSSFSYYEKQGDEYTRLEGMSRTAKMIVLIYQRKHQTMKNQEVKKLKLIEKQTI
ncbi:cystatin-like fold lipoprotein [Bacillus halotolerans]|nr:MULTISPECIES: cystatin-like fold lipoprotein [Bacillus]MCY8475263.1 cystatin-like fold lipoprotein [Bacillus halotolerans]WHY25018.1 cystatin-like fold lipoprotein [Bacillus halotolerans]